MPATILVAEDQTDIRDLLVMNLRGAGYEVTAVSDGEQALARYAERASDLLILDLMMPPPDGFTLCRMLRADPSFTETPILIITAMDISNSRATSFGANDYLAKPFNLDEIVSRVNLLLNGSYD